MHPLHHVPPQVLQHGGSPARDRELSRRGLDGLLQDQVLHETDEQEEEQKMLYTSNLLKAIGKEMDIKHLILIDE